MNPRQRCACILITLTGLCLALLLMPLQAPVPVLRAALAQENTPSATPFSPGAIGPAFNVGLVSETVNISLVHRTTPAPNPWSNVEDQTWKTQYSAAWTNATVEATLVFHNQSSQDEAFEIWFPLNITTLDTATKVPRDFEAGEPLRKDVVYDAQLSDPVRDFVASMDGNPVKATLHKSATDGIPGGGDRPDDLEGFIAWVSWPARFPARKDAVVRIRYTLLPEWTHPVAIFTYNLIEGSRWQGAVKDTTITLQMPFEATSENFSFSKYVCDDCGMPSQAKGNQLVWHIANSQRDRFAQIVFCVLDPDRWADLVSARQAVASSPQSALAQLQLGTATLRATKRGGHENWSGGRYDYEYAPGVCSVSFGESEKTVKAAYQRLLALAPPDRVQTYDKYARWLFRTRDTLSVFGHIDDWNNPTIPLSILAQDFRQWPDDPIYLWLQKIIKSPDFSSYAPLAFPPE